MLLDMYDDRGALLQQYFRRNEDYPEEVQRSGMPKTASLDDFGPEDYAVMVPMKDHIKPTFPIMDEGATMLSCLYFEHTHSNFPNDTLRKTAAVNLRKACDQFDLDPTPMVTKFAAEYQETPRLSSLRIPYPDQAIQGTSFFPVSTPEQIKTASSNFDKIMRKLDSFERREFALNLEKAAAEHELDMPENISNWTGNQVDLMGFMEAIEQRVARVPYEIGVVLRKTADEAANLPADEAANFLRTIDEEFGLEPLWDREIRDPESIRAFAPAAPAVVKIADMEIPRDQWETACRDFDILAPFEPSVQQELLKNPEVLEHYKDHPIAGYIVERLQELGIVPDGN